MSELIPIDTIEADDYPHDDEPFVPQTLSDDPDTGDGSSGRDGVEVMSWRLHTLSGDRLGSVSEPQGRDRRSRRARRALAASRNARTERGRTSRRRARVAVGLVVTLLVAGVVAACVTYVLEMWGGKAIPNVVGISQGNAQEQLEAKGLCVSVELVPADTVEGHVVAVEPPAGTRVDEGSTVRLMVGQARVIPEVVGLTKAAAQAALEDAGAQNVRFESRVLLEEEDVVLEVSPAAGSVFMSSDEVTVVVSQLPRVPDVVGQDEAVALAELERDGIPAHTVYERADVESRLHVVRTTPAVGERVEGEGVTLYVGDPLVSVARLADYFDTSTSHVAEFLQQEQYQPVVGHLTQDGHLVARYASAEGTSVAFVSDPWSHAVDADQTPLAEVMSDDHRIEGVRLSIPLEDAFVTGSAAADAEVAPEGQEGEAAADATSAEQVVSAASKLGLGTPTVSETTARDVMRLCGFDEILGSCTQTTIKSPAGTGAPGHVFYCCSGEEESYVWTVLVRGESRNGTVVATKAVATCVPRSAYATIDLTPYSNSICDFVAYQDEYQ